MKKERYEWIRSWCEDADKDNLPRVLLIGDSITEGYQGIVRESLRDICYVDYLATSYAVDTKMFSTLVNSLIKDSNYSVIHFNNGLHGAHISKRTYKSRIRKLVSSIKAKLIMATSTIIYTENNAKIDIAWKKRLLGRNGSIKELCAENNFTLDDLFEVSLTIPKTDRSEDGTHYRENGCLTLAKSVIKSIKALLS